MSRSDGALNWKDIRSCEALPDNPARQGAISGDSKGNAQEPRNLQSIALADFSNFHRHLTNTEVAATGLEHNQLYTEKSQIPNSAGINPARPVRVADDLLALVEAWGTLPEAIRRAVAALIKSATEQ